MIYLKPIPVFLTKTCFMKCFLLFLTVLLLFNSGFSQRMDKYGSNDEYMAKSKRLLTEGWISLGAGSGMMIAGIILIANGEKAMGGYIYGSNLNSEEVVGALVFYGGAICSLGSIPLLIVGHVMRKKAMRAAAFIHMEQVPDHRLTGMPLQPFPALGIRISLLN
jgi:hypothetical protein